MPYTPEVDCEIIDPSIVEQRRKLVSQTVDRVRQIEQEQGVTRAALRAIETELVKLSKHKPASVRPYL